MTVKNARNELLQIAMLALDALDEMQVHSDEAVLHPDFWSSFEVCHVDMTHIRSVVAHSPPSDWQVIPDVFDAEEHS